MKICYIVQDYNNEGRIEKVLRNIISELIHEHEIHIVTSSIKDIQHERIKFHKVKTYNRFWIFKWVSFFINSYFVTKRINKKEKFDIVHKHSISYFKADFFTAHSVHKIALKNNAKYQTNILNQFLFYLKTLYPFSVLIEKTNLKQSRYITAVSTGIKKELIKEYDLDPRKISVIFNGAEIEHSHKILSEISGINQNDLKLIFVAKEYIRKGLIYILDALDLLKKKGFNNIKLLILGEDKTNLNYFIKYVKNKGLSKQAIFLGHKKNVYDYYYFSDLFVFPTTYEAFSLATLEASISKLPLICSKTNGTDDLVINGYNGFLVSRNKISIANSILYFLNNSEQIKKMGHNAKLRVINNFSWKKIANQYLKKYKEIKYDENV